MDGADLGNLRLKRFSRPWQSNESLPPPPTNQVVNSILFLYTTVIKKEISRPDEATQAKILVRLSAILTFEESPAVLAHLDGYIG